MMKLSATGLKWRDAMRRIYTMDRIMPIILRAEDVARERGGRMITRDDLIEALDIIAQQELVQLATNEIVWG